MPHKFFDNLSTKKYNAREVAEMANTHSSELCRVDFGLCSEWYEDDLYFENVFSQIERKEDIDATIDFIVLLQKYQTDVTHNISVCYRPSRYQRFVPKVDNLKKKLCMIQDAVLESRKIYSLRNSMVNQWLSTNTSPSQAPVVYDLQEKSDKTLKAPQYMLEDLPYDVRNQIMYKNNEDYTEFVSRLKGCIKEWIDKHNLKDWNVVRFICRRKGIVAHKCSMDAFSRLLEHIGLGNQTENMKKRQDANDKLALKNYDLNKSDNLWKLRKDGAQIEELLQGCFIDDVV